MLGSSRSSLCFVFRVVLSSCIQNVRYTQDYFQANGMSLNEGSCNPSDRPLDVLAHAERLKANLIRRTLVESLLSICNRCRFECRAAYERLQNKPLALIVENKQ